MSQITQNENLLPNAQLSADDSMQWYAVTQENFDIYGVFSDTQIMTRRMDLSIAETVSQNVARLCGYGTGGRIRFSTDAPFVLIKAIYAQGENPNVCNACVCYGFDLYRFENGCEEFVGAGRPDQADIAEIQEFARGVLNAIKEGKTNAIIVPGNYPYKEGMKVSATPISLSSCGGCGYCVSVCPMDAIMVSDGCVVTDIKKCILCLTCTAKCPTKSRVLPTPLQEGITQKLSPFKDVYRKNEFYISY